ncbi:MAG TPA: hypothetical protein VHA57_05760 [Actinomycetota bacterium]|nr:hypothetical protein [Actinomycetota bacterium]
MDSAQRDLQDVAASIRAELRREAEEAEREAAVAAGMRRSLADVAGELMAHGDTVAIDAAGHHFAGQLAAAGADVVTLASGSLRVDIALGAVSSLRVLERARTGGLAPLPGSPSTLRARLNELQLSGQEVEVGVTAAEEQLTGRVALVGSDHVAIGEEVGPEWFVPLNRLAFLRIHDPEG